MSAGLRRSRFALTALVLIAVASTGCTKEFRKNRHLKRERLYEEKKYKEAILGTGTSCGSRRRTRARSAALRPTSPRAAGPSYAFLVKAKS
jgi:hypothetical protein